MNRFLLVCALSLIAASVFADAEAPAAPELTRLLREFLAGAGANDPAAHERFWADDLIYTGSSGRRLGKADILREVQADNSKPTESPAIYSAEDIRVQQYGDVAVVAFRLLASSDKDGGKETKRYFNTGTFVKRDGKWQVVAWQATAIPADEAKP